MPAGLLCLRRAPARRSGTMLTATASENVQDVWPVASRMVDVYRGGGGIGGFGGYYSGLQHKGPSAPYLQFSAGGSKVPPACAARRLSA